MSCMEYYEENMDVCPLCHEAENRTVEPLHLEPGTLLNRRYLIGRSLAVSENQVIYIARDKLLGRKIAVREYLPGEYATRSGNRGDLIISGRGDCAKRFQEGMEAFQEEGRLLCSCGQLNGLIHTYETFCANRTAYITTEYVEGEILSSFLEHSGRISEEDAMEIMMPVLKTIGILHARGIVLGGISPENIYMVMGEDGRLSARLLELHAAGRDPGSEGNDPSQAELGYRAPEWFRADLQDAALIGEEGPVTGAADVYSVAAVLYHMVTGVMPPDAMTRRLLCQEKKKDPLVQPIAYNAGLSGSMDIALMNAMNLDTRDRTETSERFLEELVSLQPVERRGRKVHTFFYMRWPKWARISVPPLSVLGIVLLFFAVTAVFSRPKDTYVLPENMVRVPDFVGTDLESAGRWAEERGLNLVSADSAYVPKAAEGLILAQSLNLGQIVEKGTTVNVTIAVAKQYYSMPDITGMSMELAGPVLKAMGIEVRTVTGEETGYHEGCIISQDIEPFTEVSTGDVVTLTLAGETVTHMTKAPELTGISLERALKRARRAGVLVRVAAREFGDYEDNTVLEQSIAPGEDVRGTNSVKLTVGMRRRSFRVPNLIYRTEYAAGKILGSMGIGIERREEKSEVVAYNHIIEQSVMDVMVSSGDTVVLTISAGGRTFPMPSVLEMLPEEAQTILEEAGLKVKFDYGFRKSIDEGCIMAQSTEPEEEVCKGMEIVLTICTRDSLDPLMNVVGETKEKAADMLHGQGMLLRYEYIYDEQVPEGSVISQVPEAGTKNPERTVITLTISRGREEMIPEETEPRETRPVQHETDPAAPESTGGETTTAPTTTEAADVPTDPAVPTAETESVPEPIDGTMPELPQAQLPITENDGAVQEYHAIEPAEE